MVLDVQYLNKSTKYLHVSEVKTSEIKLWLRLIYNYYCSIHFLDVKRNKCQQYLYTILYSKVDKNAVNKREKL